MQHPIRRKFKLPAVKACHANPASRANGCLPCYNEPMSSADSEASRELIASLGAKYMWWPAVSAAGHGEERIIAQVMDIGSYDDILRIEAVLGRERLAEVMRHAQPGWISARSWDFWRGRLRAQAGLELPERPPRRTFYAAAV
jgi:hypothetical protein